MLETRATIVALEGEEALVVSNQVGCGQCESTKNCAGSTRFFCSSKRHFRVRNMIGAAVGQEVKVIVAEGLLLRSTIIFYLLPLLLALACGGVASHYAASTIERDGYAALGALLGLGTGLLLSKRIFFRSSSQGLPVAVSF